MRGAGGVDPWLRLFVRGLWSGFGAVEVRFRLGELGVWIGVWMR